MTGTILSQIDLYALLWIFCVYSFLGWISETLVGIIKYKKFTNKGFLNGPYCVIYGVVSVIGTIGFWELKDSWLFLFLGFSVLCTVVQWLTAKGIGYVSHMRLWDYSDKRFNVDGYICLQYTVLWGIVGVIGIKYFNPLILKMYSSLSGTVLHVILWMMLAVIAVDILGSYFAARGMAYKYPRVERVNYKLTAVRMRIGNWMAAKNNRRLERAYPAFHATEWVKTKEEIFAQGCGFYKLFMLFIIGAFLGDITETIYCRIVGGVWMSRSSVVIGPFSLVWGLAMMFATAFLYNQRNKSDARIFAIGAILGGVYEYLCSVFTEVAFGQVFWDYSEMPFNLGGRINLLYCFFWGFAAVVWIKGIFPLFSGWIEKIPLKFGKVLTWVLLVFMVCNILISGMVLIRYTERNSGAEADNRVAVWLDEHYDNQRVEKIYPNMKSADEV